MAGECNEQAVTQLTRDTCFPHCLGFAPRVSGSTCHRPEEDHRTLVSDLDPSASQVGWQLKALSDSAARSGSADPTLSHQDVSGPGLCSQLEQPGTPALEQAVVFPTENAQGHSSDLNTGGSLGSWGLCSSLMPEGGVASLLPGGSGHAGAGKLGQHTILGEALPAGAAAPPLGDVLSVCVVPAHGACTAEPEPRPLLSTEGVLRNHAGDSDQVPHRTGTHADQRGLESTVPVGGAVVLEITDGCQVLSQGQEQIFIQTSDGLLLPHPGSVVSGEEDVVTLTEVEGPVLQTCPPEGAPHVAVEAAPSQ